MFFANLKYLNNVITLEVKKHLIAMSIEDFVEILNILCSGPQYQEIGQSEDFGNVVYFSFPRGPNSNIPSPFLRGSLHLDIQLCTMR